MAGRRPGPPDPGRRLQHSADPDGRTRWSPRRPGGVAVQQLPHRPGYPGASLLHVIGCQPGTPLDLDQALDALRQPRTAACRECDAASSLPATN
ncbi:DUF6233 domain-containing protein [Streptomyces sp. NPDC051183]|uniref:DUF6233 domain-containing protein n=1 Tax=Streptomyces sp. NPDC051183 TaxID=3155165 RepID=UPI00342FD237